MTSSFERRSVIRKFIYFGLILVLFTVSLLHRKLVINVQAQQLLLSEVGRGKADLTDSALRLTLSGAKGVAITFLWMAAIKKQERHEWNELEAAVDSLTRLQPRFISPWVYQGWNLAFNVSVECDRIRDKYYYISRGITLVCRGEEKNDPGQASPPQPWPASPELRFEIANGYHRKIGQGDESKTLRCLFDLSCIPLSERRAELFYEAGEHGKQINLEKFKQFCVSNPRFVRRLRERLVGYEKPEAILQFLADAKDIPGRIENRGGMEDYQRLSEFPILPPQNPRAPQPYPDWHAASLATDFEDFDVFTCVRSWHTFAQIPLPPPNKDAGAVDDPPLDRLKYRLPKFTTIIFRYYPALIQSLIAEELQKDGWFDDDGWRITEWFDGVTRKTVVMAGTGSRYDSSRAWNKAFEWWHNYGLVNGIYLEPPDMKKLVEDALKLGPQSFAARKLGGLDLNRNKVSFEVSFRQSRVERTPEAIAARRSIFDLDQQIKAGNPNIVSAYRAKVLPQWLDLLIRYPEFRQLIEIQEQSYRLQADYLWQLQKANRDWLPKMLKEALYAVPTWPLPGMLPPPPFDPEGKLAAVWPLSFLRQAALKGTLKVLPVRAVEGPYDQLFVLEGPEVEILRPLAQALARQALWPPAPQNGGAPDVAFARFVVWPPMPGMDENPEIGVGIEAIWPPANRYFSADSVGMLAGTAAAAAWPKGKFMMLSSAEQRLTTTRVASQREPPPGQGWVALIPWQVALRMRNNIAWMQETGK